MSELPSPTGRRAFVFAGGGTGGHIYPALAIIEQLRVIEPDVDVHILCSNRAIDTQVLDQEDVPFTVVAAMPVSRRPRGLIRFITGWGPSVRATRQCIQGFAQTNDSVTLVAMGGFVAAPCARGGHAQKAPVVLVNLDAVPGKANVLIAKKATTIFTAAKITGFEHWQRVRPIVRSKLDGGTSAADARVSFGLDREIKTLLITGGSQGAASITGFVRQMLEHQPDAFAGWQVIHQVGSQISDQDLALLRKSYAQAGVKHWVNRYIDHMDKALALADLSIGRCGAGTVAESWDSKLPSLFFPYPYHADEHQKHNAQVLVDAGCAVLCDDQIDPASNYQAHNATLLRLLTDDEHRCSMREGFSGLGSPDGAQRIARALLET